MTTIESIKQKKVALDFEISRNNAPRFWGWYYLKPLNEKAHAFLLNDFNPDYQFWDKERDALQLDQRDMEELMDTIDQSAFTADWKEEAKQ